MSVKAISEKEGQRMKKRPAFNRPAPKKPRPGEVVGGGFIVARLGGKTGRIRASAWPYEHGTRESAEAEAQKLAREMPGERFVVMAKIAEIGGDDAKA